MFIHDVFGVIYAPYKTFKRIVQNPKYLAIAFIVLLFVSLQTTYYYSYYSKVNHEQTMPPLAELCALTAATDTELDKIFPAQVSKPWTTSQGAAITINDDDYIEQNFYANNSLQFTLYNSNSLSATLERSGYSANCDPDGFTSLSLSMKQGSQEAALPTKGTLTLYTANSTSNYFTCDITPMIKNNSYDKWNNLTIAVGSSAEWQSTGTPNWSDVTGLTLELSFPESSNIDVLLQGIFFRGQYLTQINALGIGSFFGYVAYSIVIQVAFQWLILTAIAYVLFKCFKATNVAWRPLFIVMGFTIMALVIIAAIGILSTFALQTVYYPYDFPPYGALVYPEAFVNTAAPASQIAYESIVVETNTYTTVTTAINVFMYMLQVAIVTFAVKAISGISYVKRTLSTVADVETSELITEVPVSEFSYVKSILIAAITVVLSTLLLVLLSYMNLF
ncbi:MAG: hypothetical protein LBH62_07010 [Nitrososphaerota archaeon]|uniref:hypothetical protein n=1 Tax=Candidatus Bathycorpusculum sp. TaxID=2994959 RepID=UPI0028339BF4|nr:hypothetical protein [Candidatus Termiticorpusculum sp.]MCL2257808.1 hypothetical protein [Candidatus Termiticorpusculum sp.]MCL2292053.1 hypothetical protein [Candidatus Termiticorpusculum sp.]MDR0461160.1 hypothetical protein [Nitrososphaerota archaeon]